MCNCTATEEIRKLADVLRDRAKDEVIGKYVEHNIVTCNGTSYKGIIKEVEAEHVVIEIRRDRGAIETAFVRFCCLCSIIEIQSQG